MATNTTYQGLRKPSTSDLIDVVQDLDNNFDKLDAAPGTILKCIQRAPAVTSIYTTPGASALGAVDSANLRVTTTFPPSGKVLVRFSAFILTTGTTQQRTYFCLLTHGTTTLIGFLVDVDGGYLQQDRPVSVEEQVTGTPGAAIDWDWGFMSQASGSIYAGGITVAGDLGSPAIITVIAL